MKLSPSENLFLEKHTKLPAKQVKILTEEERDIQLLFEALSTRGEITKDELLQLSLTSYFRFLVYKYSPASLSLDDKTYLADSLSSNYKKFKNIKKVNRPANKLDENKAEAIGQYYLTALCMLSSDMKKFRGGYNKDFWINLTNNAFSLVGKRSFAANIDKYVEIVQKIREEKWF